MLNSKFILELRDGRNNQSRHPFFFTTNDDLTRHAGFRGIGHSNVGDHSAACDCLTKEFQGVGGCVDGNVSAFKRLQRQGLCKLFGCI